jgi:serine/threonine protein kinase
MIGQSVGGYTIVERIGAGGMGEVYVAEHRRLDRRAAIKFLLPGLSRDADLVSRFFNEARALSRIDHPGIVQVLDCDVLADRAYIVMELLEGESMAAVLARTTESPAEPRQAAAVAGQVASALALAHEKGIIHRDLKPDNVFFALGRQAPFGVKILDFGIAKLATDNFGATSHTRPGSLLGTPAYMAPEQCRGIAGIDHRVDIYALGCITFEMVAGRRVFTMEAQGDLLVAHIQQPPPRLASCAPDVPAGLDELVAAMLAKNPDDRPQTMGEVISLLEALLGVPVASFGEQIPADSALVPRAPASRPRPAAVQATELPAGSAPVSSAPAIQPGSGAIRATELPADSTPVSSAPASQPGLAAVRATELPGNIAATPTARAIEAGPAPMPGRFVPGGTQILPPEEALDAPPGEPASSSNSTFRRTASEIIPIPPRRPPARLVVSAAGLAAAGVALVVALTVRSGTKQRVRVPDPAPMPEAAGSVQPETSAPSRGSAPALAPPAPRHTDDEEQPGLAQKHAESESSEQHSLMPSKRSSGSRKGAVTKATSRLGEARASEGPKAEGVHESQGGKDAHPGGSEKGPVKKRGYFGVGD